MKIDLNNPLQIIIFGVTGDLAVTKLLPSLFNLFQRGKLGSHYSIIGFSRRDWSDSDFQNFVREEFEKGDVSLDGWDDFSKSLKFVPGDFSEKKSFDEIKAHLQNFDEEGNFCSDKIFYLSVPPNFYNIIFENLKSSGLSEICGDKEHSKVVVEKPFGHDFESAQKLNSDLCEIFDEKQIYRIDHVLGKDTLVDIYSFRKNNFILSELIKGNSVDHIQISFLESKDIKSRGSFYEKTGVVRDMIQNHLLQMLAVATMDTDENDMWKSRNEIIKNVQTVKKEDMIFGQYTSGKSFMGKDIIGYRDAQDVDPNSNVPTFFACKTHLNAPGWDNTPVYIRTGKALQNKFTEITFVFKSKTQDLQPNMLSFRLQPQEGVYLVLAKRDLSEENKLENIHLDFCYKYNDKKLIRDAYENLLLQVIQNNRNYFVDIDEVLSGWKFADPINQEIESKSELLQFYEAGSWGPKESYELIEKDGRKWYTEEFQLVCRI